MSSLDLGLVDVGPLDSDGTSQSLHCLRSVCLRRPARSPRPHYHNCPRTITGQRENRSIREDLVTGSWVAFNEIL